MSKVRLSDYDNSWYQPGGFAKRLAWMFINAIFFNHSLAFFNSLKITLLRAFGAKIGKGVLIKPSVQIKYPWFLQIGNDVWIGEGVWIDNLTNVSIMDNVCISQGALLLTGNHNFKSPTFDLQVKPINIESGAWVGAKVTICPGVTVGEYSVITVGSVLAKDSLPYGIYQGIPAEKIRERKID